MARQKTNNFVEVFNIFFSSLKTYFMYFDQCLKYMSFPIFGQIISIIIIFWLTYYLNTNVNQLRSIPFLQSDSNLLIAFCIVLCPFYLILISSIYRYIIAFESLNILFYMVSPNKKVKNIDFKANDKSIERRLLSYILLMFIVSLIFIIPPLIIISPILWIFLSLCFQVHALEKDTSAFSAVERSINLVKGNFIPTLIMIILCYILTYWFLPQLFIWFFDKISINQSLISFAVPFMDLLPISQYHEVMPDIIPDSVVLSRYLVEGTLGFIFIAYTLPFRCCCFTQLYRLYDSEKIKEYSKESQEIIKRASNKRK